MFFNKTKKKATQSLAGQFALCEAVTATATSPKHIRMLTDVGMKTGGGADTNSLCGRQMSWDLSLVTAVEIHSSLPHQNENYRYCLTCVEALLDIHSEEVHAFLSR